MRIAQARPADLDTAIAIERAAFDEEEVVTLVRELADDPSALPALSLLAYESGEPVGHVLFTAARVEGASRDVSAAIMAPLAVVPAAQGRGVGSGLIARGTEILAGRGVDLVFVLGYPAYYTRHGFAPAFPMGLPAPYPITPEEAWMVRELRPGLLGTVCGTVACAEAMAKPEYWRE